MSPSGPVERRIELAAPPAAVWEAVTDSRQLSAWFGADVDLELRAGGPARFRGHDGSHRHGLVEEVDEGRRLVFRWWPLGRAADGATRVEITIEPVGAGTVLAIVETPLGLGPQAGAGLLVASR
jgi:uncharacterized protein YndB with AHSA1/START domain